MFPGARQLVDAAPPEGAVLGLVRPRTEYWPPRPSTIIAAVIVGASLIWMNFVEPDLARGLSDRYGWPFAYRLTSSRPTGPSRALYAAALGADLMISAALLASAFVTTQLMACLLVKSPRVTVRLLGQVVVASALFLAGCRLRENFLAYFLIIGFCYGLASFIVLVTCLLLRLELPRRDDLEGSD
jgi:hypothetical protein